jgi:electron transfer flavoprotein beta subunit
MRVCVLVKQVLDTSVRLQVASNGLEPLASGCLPVFNPYDEFALEAALLLREAAGKGEVVLASLCAESAEETLFHGLAMGADRAVAADWPGTGRPSLLQTGLLLAGLVRDIGPDLVFCGERAADDDAAQVGPIVAEALGWPGVCGVETAELAERGRSLRLRCSRGGDFHSVSCPLPAVASFLRGPQLPRYPSMAGIFSAKTKPVARVRVAAPGAGAARRVGLCAPREERARELLAGTPGEAAAALAGRLLRAGSARP